MSLMERQLALEQEMVQSGRARFEAQLQKAIAQGRLSEHSVGLGIILRSRAALARSLEGEQDRTGKMGPRSTKTGRYLAGIPTEETAHLMISTVLNKVSSERTASLQAVAGALAWNVEGYVQSWGGRVSGLAEGERIASLPVTEHQLLGLSSFAILREVAPDLFHVREESPGGDAHHPRARGTGRD